MVTDKRVALLSTRFGSLGNLTDKTGALFYRQGCFLPLAMHAGIGRYWGMIDEAEVVKILKSAGV